MGTQNRVTAKWLFEHGLDDHIVIVDCRFDLADPAAGLNRYEEDHIPGAVYLDLDRHLSGPDDQLRPVFDFVLIPREPPDQRGVRVVDPLDNVNEFIAKFV